LDFSQASLYKWFVDGTIERQGVADRLAEILLKAIGLAPYASIKTKKLRFVRELRRIATTGKKEEAFNDLLQHNCYGLF
jgi:hypothetical protein